MAITNLIDPVYQSSAHDDLWHVATSDNATQADFKYVFDVYSQGKQLIRAKIYPNPANQKGYFNVSNIVSNQMKFDWFKPNGDFINKTLNASGEIYLDYEIKVGEDVAGVTTTNMESGLVTVANCIPNLFFRRMDKETAILDNTSTRFLTNRERTNKTSADEDFYIGVCKPGGNPELPHRIVIKQYRSDNSFVSSGVISESVTATNIFQLNISVYGIEQKMGNNYISSNTEYYDIELQDWSVTLSAFVIKDVMRLYFDCKRKYETINLHFMNTFGLFDTARFNCVSKLSMDVERKTFEKSEYTFGNTVNYRDTFTYGNPTNTSTQYFESKINFGSKYQWSYKLTMDFPTDKDYEWLSELIMSPQVWAEINHGFSTVGLTREFYPVSIKATNFEYSKHINNGLRPFEVEIDMNQKRNGFRR